MSEQIEVRLVPVEVFGAGCLHDEHENESSYGLMDAVQAWSDCNRAEGHIFRFDDDYQIDHRLPGETLKCLVDRDEYEAFAKKFWGDDPPGEANRIQPPVTRAKIDTVINNIMQKTMLEKASYVREKLEEMRDAILFLAKVDE